MTDSTWTTGFADFFARSLPERDGSGVREWSTRLTALVADGSEEAIAAFEAAAEELPWYARGFNKDIAKALGKELSSSPTLRVVQHLILRTGDPKQTLAVLANPHLRQVQGVEVWPRKQSPKVVAALCNSALGDQVSLCVRQAPLSADGVATLLSDPRFANARSLGFPSAKLKGTGLSWLAAQELPNLRALDLRYAADRIPKKASKAFAHAPFVPRLYSLSLGSFDCKTKEKAWHPFFEEADLSGLRELILGFDVYDSDLDRMARRPLDSLVSLEIHNPWELHEDAIVSFFENACLPSLRRLKAPETNVTVRVAQALLKAPWYAQLQELSLAGGDGRALLEEDGRLPLNDVGTVAAHRWKEGTERW